MKFGELNQALAAHIAELDAVEKLADVVKSAYREELNTLSRLYDANVQKVVEGMGSTSNEMLGFFDNLDEQIRPNFLDIRSRLKQMIRKAQQDEAELASMEHPGNYASDLEGLDKNYKDLRDYERERRDLLDALDYSGKAKPLAQRFLSRSNYLYKNFDHDKFARAGAVRRFFGEAFSSEKRDLRELLDSYQRVVRTQRRSDEAKEIVESINGGDLKNPSDFLDAYTSLSDSLEKAHNHANETFSTLSSMKHRRRRYFDLSKEVDPSYLVASVKKMICEELAKNPKRALELAKVIQPAMILDEHIGAESFTEDGWSLLSAKIKGYKAIIKRIDSYSMQIDEARQPLKKARRKISDKLHRIRLNTVKGFELDPIDTAVSRITGNARSSLTWFSQNRSRFANMSHGSMGDDLLLWTALYMTFSGSEVDAGVLEGDMAESIALFREEMSQMPSIGGGALPEMAEDFVPLEVMGSQDFGTGLDSAVSTSESLSDALTGIDSGVDAATRSLGTGFSGGSSSWGGGSDSGVGSIGGDSSSGDFGSSMGDFGGGF